MYRALLVCSLVLGCAAEPADPDVYRPDFDVQPPLQSGPVYGTIEGDCDVIDAGLLASSSAAVFTSTIDFADVPFDVSLLSDGGQEVVSDGNLNDGSLLSEAMAYEVLYRCELAALLLTEAEISYDDPNGKKTDLLVEIEGANVGVSVTRAFTFPLETPFTEQQAADLLSDKLSDIPLSAANATAANAWDRSVLSIIAYDEQATQSLLAAYHQLDSSVTLDTILFITSTDGDDAYLY